MAISDKLNYLIETKQLFKDRLNSLGAEITSSTTFRNYLTWLDTFYEKVSDKTDLSVNGVVGRTSQETTTGANLNIFPYGTGGNGNGITFTINNDGTVVLNGTNNGNGNSARIFYNNANNPMIIEAGRYYMIPPNNTNIVYVMTDGTNYYSFNNNNGYSQLFNSNLSVKQFYVQVAKNNTTTFTNEKIYPMLATTQVTQSDWESYTGGQPSPNPDYPQPINNLTGNVAYKITTQNGEQTFTIPLGDIELCKIDAYEDKIYSSNGRFYLRKESGKITLNGSENWEYAENSVKPYRYFVRNLISDRKTGENVLKANYFKQVTNLYSVGMYNGQNVNFGITDITTINNFKAWLSTHNTIVYYVLAAPTTTEITQENYPSLYNALKQIQDYLTAYKINKEFILGYSSPEIEY